MPPQPDGVSAVGFRLGAGASSAGIPHEGKGQFYLVCAGTLEVDGKSLSERSVIRVEPTDPAVTLVAGVEGAQVLGLQFCAPCERPGTDPAKLASRAEKGYVNLRSTGP